MNIHIQSTKLDLTPSIKKFIDDKFGTLKRFSASLEKEGALDLFIEISRSTRHHQHGEVFYSEATLQVPGKTLRAEIDDVDIRKAIMKTRDTLKKEIVEYKNKKNIKNK
jgi:ribosomal subunit interface protein